MDTTVQDPPTPVISGVPLEQLTATYIKIRDARSQLKQQYEAQDVDLERQLRVIEQEMLEICKAVDANSIRTDAGTVIRSVKSRYWTNDWDSMYRFIKEHDAYALLEKRLHQSHMKQFLEENPEIEPAGLNVEREYTVVVRRSKES
jgi:hypothetical protein